MSRPWLIGTCCRSPLWVQLPDTVTKCNGILHQFCLLTGTMIWLHRLLVPYSITRMIKKDIMISFVIGGKSMLAHHLPFQTLQTITFSHTAMHLLLCFSIFNFFDNF